jgi:hypothetical protein
MTIKQRIHHALYFVYPFVSLVVWQTLANAYGLWKPSLFLEVVREFCSSLFEWIGYQVGYWLNLYEWLNILKDWFGPIIDATQEISLPLVNILCSWMYFFVGFAKNNAVAFSVIGAIIASGAFFWYFQDFFRRRVFHDLIDIICKIAVFVLLFCVFGSSEEEEPHVIMLFLLSFVAMIMVAMIKPKRDPEDDNAVDERDSNDAERKIAVRAYITRK